MFLSSHKKVLVIIFAILMLIGVGVFFYFQPKSTPREPVVVTPPAGAITIRGTMTCLPHRNTSGPQTLECAFGLQDHEGRYYALRDSDPNYKNISGVPNNVLIEVTGNFTPQEDTKYQSIGIITVNKITLANVPQRITLNGIYLCLPHKDTTGPQTDECAAGIKADDGKYYALDFSLSSRTAPLLKSGDRLNASGVFTPIEQLSTNHWQQYPIEGIFSVTDFSQ